MSLMDPMAVRNDVETMSTDAAFLFTTGRVREASLAWHGAVRRLLPLVISDVAIAAATATQAAGAAAAPLRGVFVALPMAPLEGAQLSSKLTTEDRTFSLYATAIHYSAPPRSRDAVAASSVGATTGLDDDMALAATAMYNIGLCHHLQAILHENRAPELCEKALRAYAASQRIVEGSGLRCVSPTAERAAIAHHIRGVGLLQLAIANNAGHAHEQLHRRDFAQHQLLALHVLLATLDDNNNNGGGAGDGQEQERGRTWTEADSMPFLEFLVTAVMYPYDHKISLPAPCA